MKKNNKATPFLMILVLSIVATQLSLKAVGINITPSIGTVVHSWGKMVSLIGGVYQPGFVAELGTLSNHLLCDEGKAPAETESSCGELACNKAKDFEFELPPPIDVNDPSVTIEEPVQEPGLKAISKFISKQEDKKADVLDTEVVAITSDVDGSDIVAGPGTESSEEVVRSVAMGTVVDESAAESKPVTIQFENRIFFGDDETLAAPKADKAKKPCTDFEKFKKLEEIKRLQEEFQLEPEEEFVDPQTVHSFGVQVFQASQAAVEKTRRFRVIIKRSPMMLPLARPHAVSNESINLVNVAE
jgi:hypothetical protein